MDPLGIGLDVVAVADLLSQVLDQVPDAPGRVLRARQDALGVEPVAEPDRVVGLVAELVKRLVPGGQNFPCSRSALALAAAAIQLALA